MASKMNKIIVNESNILQIFYDQFYQPHHLKPGESKTINVEAPKAEEIITISAGAKKVLISGLGEKTITLIINQEGE